MLAIIAVVTGVATMIPLQPNENMVTTSSSIVAWTDEELIENTPVIVKGEIIKSKVQKETKGDKSLVMTVWNFKVSESLKGDLKANQVIKVKNIGGQLGDTVTISANHADKHERDTLVLFLDKETDKDSFYGNQHYHLVTESSGVYEIQSGEAVHEKSDRSLSENKLKEKISKKSSS